MHSHSVEAWEGFSFEMICMLHLEQIKKRLGINGIATETSSWRMIGDTKHKGMQIDLIIDRADRIINLCEIKFSEEPYIITKDYEQKLRERIVMFRENTKTRKSVVVTMITTYGVMKGIHSGVVQSEVLMNDLFEK